MYEDVELAFESLKAKQNPHQKLWNYYYGDQPLQYASRRLNAMFANSLEAKWVENWCRVVVDSLLDRLQLQGFTIDDTTASDKLKEIWSLENGDLDADRVHRAGAVTGEAFVVVEQDPDKTVHMYANRPHLLEAFYADDNPKVLEMAAKWWETGGNTFLTLYYTDYFEYYVAAGPKSDVSSWNKFQPYEPENEDGSRSPAIAENPWKEIPVFHFSTDAESSKGELHDVIPLQNASNKLLADMMVAAEFGAFRQRYVVSNADVAHLKNAPNEVWEIPAADKTEEGTQVGSFDVTDLANYISAMNDISGKIAVITRTPKHYLMQTGADLSGEALLAMEAPLVKKGEKYKERWNPTWKSLARFLLKLSDITIDVKEVKPLWLDAASIQPLTEAEIIKTMVEAGLPLVTTLRVRGWSEEEIVKMGKELDEQKQKETMASDIVTQNVMAKFNAGNGAGAGAYNQNVNEPPKNVIPNASNSAF